MIRPDVMQAFVDAFADAGFDAKSFLPSYGLAEATLAVSIMPPGEGIVVELVEETRFPAELRAATGRSATARSSIAGGPSATWKWRSATRTAAASPTARSARFTAAGPSIMAGYFRDEEATDACLDGAGWLDTGDMGYMSDGYIYIVGRAKDMIIINGKNHWPQDIEWAVEQLPGLQGGDIAAFSITTPGGEETPAVLVQCRTSDSASASASGTRIRDRVRSITGMNCVIELVPPRTLPRPAQAN
jgi:fatty-acyl-CoA synthase